jgi:hypothetical protein
MNKAEYQAKIPHCCALQTAKDHWDHLALCWSITGDKIKPRGVEGPQYCHGCEIAVRAKRMERSTQ